MKQLLYWVVDKRCCDGCRLKTLDVNSTKEALMRIMRDDKAGKLIWGYDIIITNGFYWHDIKRLLNLG